MIYVRYGGQRGKRHALRLSNELVVVRTHDRRRPNDALKSASTAEALKEAQCVLRYPEAGVEVIRLPGAKQRRVRARRTIKRDKGMRFVGSVLTDATSRDPVIYTENFFIKLDDDCSSAKAKRLFKEYKLSVKRELPYAGNAYFLEAPEGTGRKVFAIAEKLLQEEEVEFCHPELIRRATRRAANPNQWHLAPATIGGNNVNAHANVEPAWALSQGDGVVIAVIDDGVDIDHEEFAGAGKIVSPRDVTRDTNDPRPFWNNDHHGTACAGVAAANGDHGASGVAPKARLMPIRLASSLGSQDEAEAFVWAADHGADVISCSWGPWDGDPTDPNDPLHNQFVALPDSTRLAIDHAVDQGRNGKGCVITWAAGNGNEPVTNDGYASYDRVIAVAACNDRSKRSYYSDKGATLWCSFPSSDFWFQNPLTNGIWTVDRMGSPGYSPTNYTDDFGGTSSACPGAAGVAALVIGRNPDLRWDQVKAILKQCCDRIDTANGAYDPNGHSALYGYGRLNALRAIELAAPPAPARTVRTSVMQRVGIQDHATSSSKLAVGETARIKDIRIHVDIEHTYIADLFVKVIPPTGSAVLLHEGTGGGSDNIKRSYDQVSTPGLSALVGISPQGTWKLEVRDRWSGDTGDIVSFGVELDL